MDERVEQLGSVELALAGGAVALKLVHTADWHLGAMFPSFEELARQQLSRARLSVLDRVLGLAERHQAHAVLCAGDLFDDPDPGPEWWQGLAKKLHQHSGSERPVFLLPGNHDPLTTTGVYSKSHPFRAALPRWVHVVDRDDFSFELTPGAVLYAAPCRSRSESRDLGQTLLPGRAAGDERIRIGMVHGTTFDLPGHQMNFPIGRQVAELKGLDYLAIGDTHGFRDVTPQGHAPTVYPSTPEPTNFGERDAGQAVLVYFPSDRRRRALVRPEPVAQWTWEEARCTSLEELRALAARDLTQHVLRLVLELSVGVSEFAELERIVLELQGSVAAPGAVGVLQLDRARLRLDTGDVERTLDRAPAVIRTAAARLRAREREHGPDSDEGELARRALYQLYQLTREA